MAKVLQARTEFASALNQVAHERNLDPEVVLDTIKQAIIAAFRKDHPGQYDETKTYDVDLNSQSGEAKVYVIDNKKKTDITPPGFGRIAAQTAKQVILQNPRSRKISYSCRIRKTPGRFGHRYDPPLRR